MPQSESTREQRAQSSSTGYTLAELAHECDARVEGDPNVRIEQVATLQNARPGTIAFLTNPRYRVQLAGTKASAVILAPSEAHATNLPRLISEQPYVTFARVAA